MAERNSLSYAAVLTDERKICEHSCHATGWYILTEEKIWAGLSSIVGRQTEGREEVGDKEYAIIKGGEGNVLEKICDVEIWRSCQGMGRRKRRRRKDVCLRERYDDHSTDSTSCQSRAIHRVPQSTSEIISLLTQEVTSE